MPPRVFVDAPALTGGVARPDERDRAPVGRRGAETADHRLALDGRRREILEADAVEDVLAGRQTFEQQLGGQVAVRQRIHECALPHVLEAVRRRNLDPHPRRAVGPRPDHAGVDRHVAGLHAMRDQRPVGRPADRGLGDTADCRQARERGARGDQPPPVESVTNPNGHSALPDSRARTMAPGADRPSSKP